MFAWNEGAYAQASTVVMLVSAIVFVFSLAMWGVPHMINLLMTWLELMLPDDEEETA